MNYDNTPLRLAALALLAILLGGCSLFGSGEPAIEAGATQVSEVDEMTMVYVPGSEFLIGSDETDHLHQFPLNISHSEQG